MREYKGFFPSGYGKTKIQLNNDTYFGFWVFGAHLTHKVAEQCPVIFSDESASDKEPEHKELIVFDGGADWNMAVPIEVKEVLPGTVCEDTGMCDKNGKSIFTNDILQDATGTKGIVVFRESVFQCQILSTEAKQKYVPLFDRDWVNIGNIFENPKFIEREN